MYWVDSRLLVDRVSVRMASVVSGEKCLKDTPSEARLYDGGGAGALLPLVPYLTLTTFSVQELAEDVDGMTGGVVGIRPRPKQTTQCRAAGV